MSLLTAEERRTLLQIAREAITAAVKREVLAPLDESHTLTSTLQTVGASFVTLTLHDRLRGCIGALEAYQPLAADVREHAIAAALQDPRFPPVSSTELPDLHIEISRLTEPTELTYSTSADLLAKLRPHVDGVILKHGARRATFLPQVWAQIPNPADFLTELCYKMGAAGDLWRNTTLKIFIYQVEEFHEEKNP